jgi:hypothetical protein
MQRAGRLPVKRRNPAPADLRILARSRWARRSPAPPDQAGLSPSRPAGGLPPGRPAHRTGPDRLARNGDGARRASGWRGQTGLPKRLSPGGWRLPPPWPSRPRTHPPDRQAQPCQAVQGTAGGLRPEGWRTPSWEQATTLEEVQGGRRLLRPDQFALSQATHGPTAKYGGKLSFFKHFQVARADPPRDGEGRNLPGWPGRNGPAMTRPGPRPPSGASLAMDPSTQPALQKEVHENQRLG